jgi:hypothetical protein
LRSESTSTFKEFFIMSSRFYLIPPALVLATLCGVVSTATAGETKPLSPETCETVTRSSVGHPGKSTLFPKAAKRGAVGCARPARIRLTLASFEDSTGGKALVSGRAERAIEQIYAKRSTQSAQTLNNLCVAHTVLRQWAEAGDACDAAVTSAVAKRANWKYRPGMSRLRVDTGAAVAYSNRAVMHWLSRDVVAAQQDLANARAIAPRASYVMRNSDVAASAPALAQNVVLAADAMS